jgi:hypothetical protein
MTWQEVYPFVWLAFIGILVGGYGLWSARSVTSNDNGEANSK